MEVLEKIIEIVASVMEIPKEQVNKDTKLADDLKIDELDGTEIAMAIEEAFDIIIPDEEIDKFTTVESIANYVSSKVVKESGDK